MRFPALMRTVILTGFSFWSFAPADSAPIQWRTNLESALADARSSGKPVLLDFYADWCGYCRKLRAEVYPSAEVTKEAQKFVTVTVNVDKNHRAAAKYSVDGLPTVLFLDSNGHVLDRIAGFVDARTFARRMRDATRRNGTGGGSELFVHTFPLNRALMDGDLSAYGRIAAGGPVRFPGISR